MKLYCPNCNAQMNADEMNPVSDIAKCDDCGTVHSIKALLHKPRVEGIDPPNNSKIIISQGADKSLQLHYPALGFNWFHLFIIPFALIWNGFVLFWAYMAAQAFIIMSFFAIPFLLVGWFMIKGIIASIWGSETVIIGKDRITLNQNNVVSSKSKTILFSAITNVALSLKDKKGLNSIGDFKQVNKSIKEPKSTQKVPSIKEENETSHFFEGARTEEQKWVISLINSLIQKMA